MKQSKTTQRKRTAAAIPKVKILETPALEPELVLAQDRKFQPNNPARIDLVWLEEMVQTLAPQHAFGLPDAIVERMKALLKVLMEHAPYLLVFRFGRKALCLHALKHEGCYNFGSLRFSNGILTEGDPAAANLLADVVERIFQGETNWLAKYDPAKSGLVNWVCKSVNMALLQMEAGKLYTDCAKYDELNEQHLTTPADVYEEPDFELVTETHTRNRAELQAAYNRLYQIFTAPEQRLTVEAAFLGYVERTTDIAPSELECPSTFPAKLERMHLGLLKYSRNLEALGNSMLVAA